MRIGALVVGVLLSVGCQKDAAPTVSPGDVGSPDEPMLEALVVDDAGGTAMSAEGCHAVPAAASFDDSTLPQFNRRRARKSNMHRGNESLDDVQLHSAMMPLQGQIMRCVEIAECHTSDGDDVLTGSLAVEFELGNDGKVRAATVKPSGSLDTNPVIPCARMALANYEFPGYDGGNMFVEYEITIE